MRLAVLTALLLCLGCTTTPETAKPPVHEVLRAGAGCAPRVAFCVLIEDDPVVKYETVGDCREVRHEMQTTVELYLTQKMMPGPYLIDVICGDRADLTNYGIYLEMLAAQMLSQLKGQKKRGGV